MQNRSQILTTFFIIFGAVSSLLISPACGKAATTGIQEANPANSTAAEAISLRPQFVLGQVTVYEFTAAVQADQVIEELEMSNKTSTNLIMRLEVVEQNEETGQAIVNINYDRLALSGANSMSNTSYAFDSAAPPMENKDLKVAALLSRLKDSQLIATVTAEGQVLSVTGNEAVLTAMQRNEILAGRIGEFNQDGIKQVLEGFWRVGEDDVPRLVGQSWTESQDMEMPSVGTLTFSTIFDLQSADENEAQLEVLLDVTLELQKDLDAAAEGEAEAEEGGPIKGEDDPENLVLNPEAKLRAEQKAFQDSLPVAERADLFTEKTPGKLVWDRQRNELIERETYLNFTLEIEQFEIFSQAMQVSSSLYDVVSKWRRISTE